MRYLVCPQCRVHVDATAYDPLAEVMCSSCRRKFVVLKEFDDYKIQSSLAKGGTSAVYLAKKGWNKLALKVLLADEVRRNPESVTNFLRELELTQGMKHPNLVEIYKGGCFQGFPFMALELVEGEPVDKILSHIQPPTVEGCEPGHDPLPELICLEIGLQAAAALGVAHEHHLVHGDIKPENIMVTYDGVVKVVDFGLVQFANAEKLFTEGEGYSVFGTPLYIPPERVRGEPEDSRSDLYSLGATLYHLLRGLPPYRAKGLTELAIMHTEAPMLTFRAVAPNVSPATCRIIEKSLKKSVDARYASIAELITDLSAAKEQVAMGMNSRDKVGWRILKKFMRTIHLRKRGWPW